MKIITQFDAETDKDVPDACRIEKIDFERTCFVSREDYENGKDLPPRVVNVKTLGFEGSPRMAVTYLRSEYRWVLEAKTVDDIKMLIDTVDGAGFCPGIYPCKHNPGYYVMEW